MHLGHEARQGGWLRTILMSVIMSHVKEEERSSRQRELEKDAEEHKRLMAREEHVEQLRFLNIIVVVVVKSCYDLDLRLESERAEQRRAQENADHEAKLVRCRLFLEAIFVLCKYQRSNIFVLFKYFCLVQISSISLSRCKKGLRLSKDCVRRVILER